MTLAADLVTGEPKTTARTLSSMVGDRIGLALVRTAATATE